MATESILEALPGDRVLQSSALATVTTNCLIVRSADDRAQTVIPIARLSGIKTAKTTYPGLLVVSAACFLIAAAAYCSPQQGSSAAVPSGILGGLFLLAYLAHRRVSVFFLTGSGETVTGDGSTGEASRLIKAVSSIRARKQKREAEETSV